MEEFNFKIDQKELNTIIRNHLESVIKFKLEIHKESINDSLDNYFKKNFLSLKTGENGFDNELNFIVERIVSSALEQAMEEMDFKTMLVHKAKNVMKESSFLEELAVNQIKKSLNL